MSASHRPTDIHLRQHRAKKRNKVPGSEASMLDWTIGRTRYRVVVENPERRSRSATRSRAHFLQPDRS